MPHWATQEDFDDLERRGLMMYGQMTAGSWIYIGTQGILQGTYETFAEGGRQHRFGGTLAGKLCVTGGCGGMGGAQPLAVTMADGTCLIADVDPTRLTPADRPLPRRDRANIDKAIDRAVKCADEGLARSIGVVLQHHRAAGRLLERKIPRRRRSPTRPARTIRSSATCPSA